MLLAEPTNSELDHSENIDEIKVEKQQQLITVDFMLLALDIPMLNTYSER